jgi:hypothetical protein
MLSPNTVSPPILYYNTKIPICQFTMGYEMLFGWKELIMEHKKRI